MDWWQCATVMQGEAVTVMPNCSGEGSDVIFIPLATVRVSVMVILK